MSCVVVAWCLLFVSLLFVVCWQLVAVFGCALCAVCCRIVGVTCGCCLLVCWFVGSLVCWLVGLMGVACLVVVFCVVIVLLCCSCVMCCLLFVVCCVVCVVCCVV